MAAALLVATIHSLTATAEFAFGRGADGTASAVLASAAFLEGEQLLASVALVVDLAGRLNQVLQMGAGEEIAEVDEFAVVLVLDIDGTPAVLAAAHLLAVDVH